MEKTRKVVIKTDETTTAAVTVFEDRAEVTRLVSLSPSGAGTYELCVQGLPDKADEDSIRCKAAATYKGLTIQEVSFEVHVTTIEAAATGSEAELRAKIKELTAARSAAAAEQARSAERKAMLSTYVKGMLAPLTSAGGVAPPSAGSSLAKVEELLDFQETQAAKADAADLATAERLSALDAELEACEIEEATRALRHFKLADAECYSAEDREAILGLISKWWTDRESGVSDPERLRQLGFHRFERFVRYELVPQLSVLAGGDWSASSFLAIYVIGIHGWVLDLLTYGPGLTVYHTLATVLYAAFMAGFWLPPTFATIQFIGGVAWRAGRRGWPPKLAFALALAASVVALLVINLLMYTLPFPNVVLDPEWRFPDDGIDEFGQKILKIQVVFAMYAVGAASLFFCG